MSDPLDGFDLNLLRALDILLSTRNVGAAARLLSVGQPAASKMLQRLRVHLRDPILVRAGREMVPTKRAHELAGAAREAMSAARRAVTRREPFEPARATARIHIAIADDAFAIVLTPLVKRLQRLSPGIDLRVRRLDRSSGVGLSRGDIDLVVLPDLARLPGARPPDLSDFVVRPLYEDRFAVVARRQPARPRWTLASYARARHVLVTPVGQEEGGFVDAILAKKGLTRRVVATVPTFFEALHIVQKSALIATVPWRLARHAGWALDVRSPPCAMPNLAMLIAWHPAHGTGAIAWVREQLTACVAEGPT